jgi:glycosyltransferase involved in cell wall biosynthesis
LKTFKVSVCLPTYNYANYIAEAIESVLAQNFSDFEFLIIDDCSKDQTAHVVESYAKKDSRIRFIINEVNLGMVENWNSCLAQAKGEYLKFVFGDDLLASPDALGRMVSLLDNDKTISLACSARNLIDESSRITEIESHFNTGIMTGTNVINHCLANQANLIGEPSVVMFRKCHSKRGFNSIYNQIVDLEMWFHLLEQGSFAYINEPLCSFRIHGQQQTEKNKENHAHLKDFINLFDDYLFKDYIRLSGFMKKYIKYDYLYGIWKLYKRNILSRENAIELINSNRSFSFFAWYPFYKLFKPLFKLSNKYVPRIRRIKCGLKRVFLKNGKLLK